MIFGHKSDLKNHLSAKHPTWAHKVMAKPARDQPSKRIFKGNPYRRGIRRLSLKGSKPFIPSFNHPEYQRSTPLACRSMPGDFLFWGIRGDDMYSQQF
jgi:hypothetical protein